METNPTVDLLIQGGTVITMDRENRIIENGIVGIHGERIVIVGSRESVQQINARSVMDASEHVVMPGLVNTHTHAAMTLFRGYADDQALEPWLQAIWQVENDFANAENVRLGTELAFLEMIRGGTTTATDMYWHYDVATEVAKRVGFRYVMGPSFIDFAGPIPLDKETREQRAREYLDKYRGDPLISACVQVHSTHTVSTQLIEKVGALAREYDALFITHASETAQEVVTVTDRFGMTPIWYLDSLHLLGSKTLLAHCVHLADDEIELLAQRGTSVAHCPESNLKLGSGIARVSEMLKRGVNVGLGTDGTASNNDLDMWEEMRVASLLQKGVHQDPTLVSAADSLKMATINGVRAVGLQDQIGSLEMGKRADIILVEMNQPHLLPMFDVQSHLVYAANKADVSTVLINGRVVMQDRRLLTIDEDAVKNQMREVGRRIGAMRNNVVG